MLAEHPSVRLFAYLDDISLVGKAADVLAASATLTSVLSEINLVLNSSKTQVFCASAEGRAQLSANGISVGEGVMVVGVPIGNAAFQSAAIAGRAQAFRQQLERVQGVSSFQHQFLFLRYCLLPQLNFLSRTTAVDLVLPHWESLDEAVYGHVASIMQLRPEELVGMTELQIGLPVRAGGLGLPKLSWSAPAAHLAGFHLGAQDVELPAAYWTGSSPSLIAAKHAHALHTSRCSSASVLLPT